MKAMRPSIGLDKGKIHRKQDVLHASVDSTRFLAGSFNALVNHMEQRVGEKLLPQSPKPFPRFGKDPPHRHGAWLPHLERIIRIPYPSFAHLPQRRNRREVSVERESEERKLFGSESFGPVFPSAWLVLPVDPAATSSLAELRLSLFFKVLFADSC